MKLQQTPKIKIALYHDDGNIHNTEYSSYICVNTTLLNVVSYYQRIYHNLSSRFSYFEEAPFGNIFDRTDK